MMEPLILQYILLLRGVKKAFVWASVTDFMQQFSGGTHVFVLFVESVLTHKSQKLFIDYSVLQTTMSTPFYCCVCVKTLYCQKPHIKA